MTQSLKLNLAVRLTFALTILLLVSFSIWQLTRPQGISWLFWVVQCLPLLMLVPGMVRHQPRAYIWLCFLMLVYFVKGVDGVVFPSRAWIDYLVLTVSVLLFTAAMLSARWLQRSPL